MSTNIAIQPRDIEFLQLLLHSRILTLKHAASFVFNGSGEAAKKRIQKLKAAGLILEKHRKAYEPGILFLSKKGFECLRLNGALPEHCRSDITFSKRKDVSELTLRHELDVLDVKVAFHEAVRKQEKLSIAEFSTWPQLHEFSVRDSDEWRGKFITVKPDGFIRLHERDANGETWEHLYFLEVDRSTERLAVFIERLRLYNLFYRSGGMAQKFGKSSEDFKDFPFRVLVVCKSEERRNNIAQILREMSPPILTQVLLSTLELVRENPLGATWCTPSDFAQPANYTYQSLV